MTSSRRESKAWAWIISGVLVIAAAIVGLILQMAFFARGKHGGSMGAS